MNPSTTTPAPGPGSASAAGPATSAPGAAGPTGAPAAAPRPPLRRPRDGRVLAGVAAGLADHLGLDVALVRLLVVLATVLTQGLGLLAYIAAIFIISAAEPGAPRPAAPRRDPATGSRSPAFWGGIALLVVGVWWLVAVTPLRFGLLPGVSVGSLAAPLLLIGVGLALWVTGDRVAAPVPPAPLGPTTSTVSPSSTPPTTSAPSITSTTPTMQEPAMSASDRPAADATATSAYASSTAASSPVSGAAPTAPPASPPTPPTPPSGDGGGDGSGWTPPPAPERSGGLLGRLTVGLVLVTVGLLWSLRLAGALTITGGQLLAAALLVVGLGLLVGAVAGRARGLIWFGAVLLPLVLIAQIPGSSWIDTVPSMTTESGTAAGELRLTPADVAELQDSYELGAGSIRLDLTELDLDGNDLKVEISVGAGEIRVIVPDDVDLDASASIGIGEIRLLERRSGGIGVGDLEVSAQATGQARGSIELELSTGIGNIRVEQAPARVPAS